MILMYSLYINKMTYVFAEKGIKNGKNQIFNDLGYSIDNANDLLEIFKVQALNDYLDGNYFLKSLDKYGQRIAVSIKLKNKEFYSGWIVEPEGRIRNATPFAGWKE